MFPLFLLSGCKSGSRIEGKDERGFYVIKDTCIKSHMERRTLLTSNGNFMVPISSMVEVCDSTIKVKSYIQ